MVCSESLVSVMIAVMLQVVGAALAMSMVTSMIVEQPIMAIDNFVPNFSSIVFHVVSIIRCQTKDPTIKCVGRT